MMEPISPKQFNGWWAVALVGPILSTAGFNGWLSVLPVAVLCPVLCYAVCKCKVFPKWLCIAQLLWLTVFLSSMAKLSGACWEGAGKSTAIPIILLALAALASQYGSVEASRVGATLLWLVIPVLAVVLLSGVGEMRTDWVKAELQIPNGALLSLLLLPSLTGIFFSTTGKQSAWISGTGGLLAVTASLLLEAAMGGTIASHSENSFYEFSKGIDLFGVAERFESLVACALTLSWFVLLCVIFSAVYHFLDELFKAAARWSVWIVFGMAAALLYILPDGGLWLGVGSLIFWVILPLLTQGLVP